MHAQDVKQARRRYHNAARAHLVPIDRRGCPRQNAAHGKHTPAIDHRSRLGPARVASARPPAARSATPSTTALDLLDKGEARVAEKIGGAWIVNQWLKKAVLLSFRLNDMGLIAGAPGGASWWDKVPSKFEGMTAEGLPQGRLPGRAGRGRAAVGLYRAGRGADALLRQPRRLRRQRHHGRHLGHGRLLRPDRQERATSRAASASAACSSRCRPTPPSSRTTASSAPAPRWSRASIVGEGSVLAMGAFIGASTKIVDRATGKIHIGQVPPYSVVVSGSLPGKPFPNNEPGPSPLLRRDRQDRGRADPRQDRHQRAAAGLDARSAMRREPRTYRALDPDKVIETIGRAAPAHRRALSRRRPRRGVRRAADCIAERELGARRADRAAATSACASASSCCSPAGVAGLGVDRAAVHVRLRPRPTTSISVLQGIEAAANLIVLMGAGVFFLTRIEERLKRRAALQALHELRSIVHVIDMHQLTKDPSAVVSVAGKTRSSPPRTLSRFEVTRYLDYCSEMLSLTSKVAVLFAQGFPDPDRHRGGQRHRAHRRRAVAEDLAEDHDPGSAGEAAQEWQSTGRTANCRLPIAHCLLPISPRRRRCPPANPTIRRSWRRR